MIDFKNTNGYPFPTQKAIVVALANDEAFQIECLSILVQRQTDDELEEKVTRHTNKRGLRCSEATWMPSILAQLRNAEEVTDEDMGRLARTLPVYRKQIAAHLREQMVAADPTLAEKSKVFGV